MILPSPRTSSSWVVRRAHHGFAAFAVQAVSDVLIPEPHHTEAPVKAFPGDKIYVKFNVPVAGDDTNGAGRICISNTHDRDTFFLGVAVLGFDTSRGDRNLKVCI